MTKRRAIHDRVLNATSTEELMKAYGDWAENYDHDLMDEMGYVAPMAACDLLKRYLNRKAARILDAGCGTGIVGQLLHQDGYRNIEGLDYSPQMLAQAERKGIYTALHRGDLTKALTLTDDAYDAVISVGTFTCGHVGPEALDELTRITHPGGYLCFTVREEAWEEDDYRARVRAIEARGRWRQQEVLTADYIREEGARCKVCLFSIPNANAGGSGPHGPSGSP